MGSDFAGEIAAIGSGVTTFAPGDRVFGFIDPFRRAGGTFAEFAAVPVEFVYHLPSDLGYRDAAALACVGATAVTLCNLGHVGTGSKVLVNGASGGVGHMAVQVASARGAVVAATASAARHEFIETLGANSMHRLSRGADGPLAGGFRRGAGLRAEDTSSGAASPAGGKGHDVTTVPDAATFMIDPLTNRCGGVQRYGVMLKPDTGVIDEALGYVAQGRLRCAIERAFPLQLARDAIERRVGRAQGKIAPSSDEPAMSKELSAHRRENRGQSRCPGACHLVVSGGDDRARARDRARVLPASFAHLGDLDFEVEALAASGWMPSTVTMSPWMPVTVTTAHGDRRWAWNCMPGFRFETSPNECFGTRWISSASRSP